jgi:polyribonucleotide 5'-hydroxyl-kinase
MDKIIEPVQTPMP